MSVTHSPYRAFISFSAGLFLLLGFILYNCTPGSGGSGHVPGGIPGYEGGTAANDGGSSVANGNGLSVGPAQATPIAGIAGPAPAAPAVAGQQETKRNPTISALLLGYGGEGHEGGYLSDSMVLAMANPVSKTLVLLTVPRDIWVRIPVSQDGYIWSKLNTAYAYGVDEVVYTDKPAQYRGANGGGNLSKDVTSEVVGIPIQFYFALDFEGFEKMIDGIGGVEVAVPSSFTASYPRNDNSALDPGWTTVHFDAGRQTMNGRRALQFARAREVFDNPSESNDFARSRRQRLIIEAFKDKLLSPRNLTRLPAVLNLARQHVVTDFSLPSLSDLQNLLVDWRSVQVTSIVLNPTNYLREATGPQGAYILEPVSQDWSQLHAFVRTLAENPPLGQQMATTEVLVQNATGRPSEGKRWADRLMAAGYRVGPPATVEPQAQSTIEDRTAGDADLIVDAVQKTLEGYEFYAPVMQAAATRGDPQIVLKLGEDALSNQESRLR